MLNRVILIGRTTQEAELSYTKQGVAYSRLTLAVDRKRFNNERQTDFIPFVLWRNQAEFAKNYIRKGTMLCIEGEIHISQYTNLTTNQLQRSFDVVVSDIKILQSRTQGFGNDQKTIISNTNQANINKSQSNNFENHNNFPGSDFSNIVDDSTQTIDPKTNEQLHELDEIIFNDDTSGLTFQFDEEN